jgi:hypothetical protein
MLARMPGNDACRLLGLDLEWEIRAVDTQKLGDTVLIWDAARLVALGVPLWTR